jgi:hypothetical protein
MHESSANWTWQSGSGYSVQIGYVNPHGQRCCGHCGVPGTDREQYAYKVECTKMRVRLRGERLGPTRASVSRMPGRSARDSLLEGPSRAEGEVTRRTAYGCVCVKLASLSVGVTIA